MPIPYGLGMSIGIHSICTTYCFFTSTIDKQPHHNITVICAVSVMFVSVFANCAVDLNNNSISTRNVKTHIFNIYIYIYIYIYIHRRNSMVEITYNNKKTQVINAFSSFRCIPVRSANTYVNQFLALTKAFYSTIVYLY